MQLRRSFAWYLKLVFPKRVYPKYDQKEKKGSGPRLTCVSGHSGAHVMEPGLKWEITGNVFSSVWWQSFFGW